MAKLFRERNGTSSQAYQASSSRSQDSSYYRSLETPDRFLAASEFRLFNLCSISVQSRHYIGLALSYEVLGHQIGLYRLRLLRDSSLTIYRPSSETPPDSSSSHGTLSSSEVASQSSLESSSPRKAYRAACSAPQFILAPYSSLSSFRRIFEHHFEHDKRGNLIRHPIELIEED